MIAKTDPNVAKHKPIRLPRWSDVGYLLQGVGIGIIIGHILDIVQLNWITTTTVFFSLVVVGGYMITSSKH